MHINTKDLNLLKVFTAVWADLNVSKASKTLGLSQPAMSHALARLRADFNDDLFVRSGRGMVSTPLARALAPKIIEIVQQTEALFAGTRSINPVDFTGRISIMGTDLIEFILFPKLLAELSRSAPKLRIVSRPSSGEFPTRDMEVGALDFVIAGFFSDIPEGFYQSHVGEVAYLSIVRKDHPSVGEDLDLKTFSKLSHILTSPHGDLNGVVDQALQKLKLKRTVVAGLTTFQVLPKLVEASDLCATLPSCIARDAVNRYHIKAYSPPIELPNIQLKMLWHQRIHNSPLHEWCRALISRIIRTELGAASAIPVGQGAR
ncbi:MAG: LysR family transcriptional regulator [Proteobacteria bacterium]|nr:LysR family transcriptional regulator [Pseudomonadota bacterium]